MEVREVVRKFVHLNLVIRKELYKSMAEDDRMCVRLSDSVLEICKNMGADEQQP